MVSSTAQPPLRRGIPQADEIDELVRTTPAAGRRHRIVVLAIVATLGSLLFGYDTGVIAGALPYMYMPHEAGGLSLNAFEEGLVTAILAVGSAFGALIGGSVNDRIGRRANILLLAGVFIVGTVGCSLSPSIWVLYPFRFVLGFAVGGASSTVPLYLSEAAPARVRGPIVQMDQFMIVFGQFVAYAMNAAISSIQGAPEATVANDPTGAHAPGSVESWDALSGIAGLVVSAGNGHAWRWMIVLATIPAIALWIGMRMMPESPRWYATQERFLEAVGALKTIRGSEEEVAGEVREMAELQRDIRTRKEAWTLGKAFSVKWTRKLLIIGMLLGAFDQFTGITTAMWYMPKILHSAGFTTANSIILNVLTGAVAVIGAFAGIGLASRLKRRHMGMYETAGIVASLLTLAVLFYFWLEPPSAGGEDVTVPGWAPWAALVTISIFIFIKQSGTINWTLLSEIFPVKIRGAAQGVSIFTLWMIQALVAFIFPPMMEYLGGALTYVFFAVLNGIAFLFYWRIVPETKDSSLEEIEERLERQYS